MRGEKHSIGKGLCPISLGLALGITVFLAIFICSVWMMYHGVPPMMEALRFETPTWMSSLGWALIGFVKGFIFGLVLALFYDLFACCCKSACCRSSDCGCACKSCDSGTCGCKCCADGVRKKRK